MNKLATLLMLLFVFATAAVASENQRPVEADKPAPTKTATSPPHGEDVEKSVEELTEMVRKSVVVVSFSGRDGRRQGLGSGFVISPDGLIATNLHVIGEARPISVQTADGKKYPVIGIHATERRMDLAIIRIKASNLTALELGDSDTLKDGQKVVAIGNPRGLKHSVVSGIVSGRREIDNKPMIQLAMPIEQGNSGGPLLDRQGRVHGILTLKSLVTRNLGFAVAINALKPLLAKPNPVPMNRWLTIGRLDPKEWNTVFGARWRQRAGRILVEGRGGGFGGRSLSLSKIKPPTLPYELAVSVRLEDESGAAGLVFHSDGSNKHYGFYPSNGKLRLSRFDGPDVFSWKVLKEIQSDHYQPGEWNTLKVRIEQKKIQCFVNDKLVIESTDSAFTRGRVGLAKFRETVAEFRKFTVARNIPASRPSEESVKRITKLVANIGTDHPPKSELIADLVSKAGESAVVLQERARMLERQAERLRQLAQGVHQKQVQNELAKIFAKDDDQIDLLQAALLIAKLDNEEVDVPAYQNEVHRMVAELSKSFKKNADDKAKLAALNKHLFEERGFHGSRTDYYNSSNSYLNEVIDDREGLPITVSVLYMEIARRIGLNVVGVGLPGHFVVRFEPKEGARQIIDVFDRGKKLSREQVVEMVTQRTNRPWDDAYLAAQNKKDIVIRMLRNLMNIAQDDADSEAMLKYVETMIVVDPDAGQQRWFRAVLRFQTDRIDEAMQDVLWLLDNKPDGVDLLRVRQLRDVLDRSPQ